MTSQTLGRRNAALVQGTELDLALRSAGQAWARPAGLLYREGTPGQGGTDRVDRDAAAKAVKPRFGDRVSAGGSWGG
jgi:hypothetical protein